MERRAHIRAWARYWAAAGPKRNHQDRRRACKAPSDHQGELRERTQFLRPLLFTITAGLHALVVRAIRCIQLSDSNTRLTVFETDGQPIRRKVGRTRELLPAHYTNVPPAHKSLATAREIRLLFCSGADVSPPVWCEHSSFRRPPFPGSSAVPTPGRSPLSAWGLSSASLRFLRRRVRPFLRSPS